jgi:hypothetical protein
MGIAAILDPDMVPALSTIVILDKPGLAGLPPIDLGGSNLALAAATIRAELTVFAAPARANLAITAATLNPKFAISAAAPAHARLALTATAIDPKLAVAAASTAARLFLAAAAAITLDLLRGLALPAVPAPVGLDRRGNRQRGRAGGKHPLHHGISPS